MTTQIHLTQPTFVPGQQVLWHYKPQEEYRATLPVPAVVVQSTALRIHIKVRMKAGVLEEIAVDPESLVLRE